MKLTEELQTPTLADVIMAGRRLCHTMGIPFDEFKIGVTTDYGTNVVVYIIDE